MNKGIGKTITDGVVLFVSVFMATKGYQAATSMYEQAVPSAIEKAHMLGLVASMSNKKDDDEE